MKNLKIILTAGIIFSTVVISSGQKKSDPLPSWNKSSLKDSMLAYIEYASIKIPVEDRIAVFDMDGTITCETPLWFEMYAAVNGLNQQWKTNPKLLNSTEYQLSRDLIVNPFDTLVTNYWGSPINWVDSMIWKAYDGTDKEAYVSSAYSYLSTTKSKDPRFNMYLSDMFYQPMIELINHLKEKKFTVFVVSGSVEGVIWSVCPKVLGLDREHLIGTVQQDKFYYDRITKKSTFIIQKGIFNPKDDKDGKSQNIYNRIGKAPVFAFGNTTSDFGMFKITSSSKYRNVCYLLNHDDSREYVYPPYHGPAYPGWQDTMKVYNWHQVDMSKYFKTVWMVKK